VPIERGKEWGRIVDSHGGGESLTPDLTEELGLGEIDARSGESSRWRELPVDLLRVEMTLRTGEIVDFVTPTCIVAGRRWNGRFCVVSSISFVERRRFFFRAHPNDGSLHWLEMDPKMSFRQRRLFFRRLRIDMHLPHPGIRSGSGDSFVATFDKPVRVRSSVSKRGVIALNVSVIPDGSVVYVPAT